MKWFQIKEQSAGKKRLVLTYFLYKIFGKKMLYLIAFLVSFFTFLFAPKVREYSKNYFLVIKEFVNIKPTLTNQFRHIYSFAKSLADKIMMSSGDFNPYNIVFDSKEDEEMLYKDIYDRKGVFFICNHIGNIELFQSFFMKNLTKDSFTVNIFMSSKQSQVFNDFLKSIKVEYPVKLFNVDDFGVDTGVELKENLNKGDIAFISGDRVAQNNDTKNIVVTMFNKKIYLPKGTYKLAKLMKVPTYFISVINDGKGYRVILERQNDLSESKLTSSCAKFMERVTLMNPFQFFNFYDYFN